MLLRMGDRPRGPAVRAGEVRRQRPQPGARRAGVPAAGQGVQGPRRRPRRPAPHGRVRASGDPRGQGAHLPAELQVAALQAGLPRGGHHIRLPGAAAGAAGVCGPRRELHQRRGRAQAHLPVRLLHRRSEQPLAALPWPQHAPRRPPRRLPSARHPQGPEHGHGVAGRAAALLRPRRGDAGAVRGDDLERLRGRQAPGALQRLRELPRRHRDLPAGAEPGTLGGGRAEGPRRAEGGRGDAEADQGRPGGRHAAAAEALPAVAGLHRALQRGASAARSGCRPAGPLPGGGACQQGAARGCRRGQERGPP
mmetsp:Transcript_68445/g.211639  ORF Transcript_68445/g.211639 Transcript_68445/m.211639 type:complete len:308 (+) Transcript_68445:2727-3650(+)